MADTANPSRPARSDGLTAKAEQSSAASQTMAHDDGESLAAGPMDTADGQLTAGAGHGTKPPLPRMLGPAIAFSLILALGIAVWVFWGQSQIAIALASVGNVVGVLMAIYQVAQSEAQVAASNAATDRRTQELVTKIDASSKVLAEQLKHLDSLQETAQGAQENASKALEIALRIEAHAHRDPPKAPFTEEDLVLAALHELGRNGNVSDGANVAAICGAIRGLRVDEANSEVKRTAISRCKILLEHAPQVTSCGNGRFGLRKGHAADAESAFEKVRAACNAGLENGNQASG